MTGSKEPVILRVDSICIDHLIGDDTKEGTNNPEELFKASSSARIFELALCLFGLVLRSALDNSLRC